MIKKIKASKIRKESFFKVGIISLFLLLGLAYVARAEDTVFPDQDGLSINSAGIRPGEILSSLEKGGLTSSQNFGEIKKHEKVELPDNASTNQKIPKPEKNPTDIKTIPLKVLESRGGLTSKPQNDSAEDTIFKSVTKFLDRVVFRGSVEFTKTPAFDAGMDISGTPTFDKDTAGYAVIEKGNQSVDIEFEKDYEATPIITATLSVPQYDDPEVTAAAEDLLLVSDVTFIVTKTSKKGFEIMMDHVADSDIPFSWNALAVKDPETFKKKGATLKNASRRFFYEIPVSQDSESNTNNN